MLREDYAEGAEVRMGNHRFICIVALGRGSYGEVWRAKVAVSLRQLAYCQKVLRNPFFATTGSRTGLYAESKQQMHFSQFQVFNQKFSSMILV